MASPSSVLALFVKLRHVLGKRDDVVGIEIAAHFLIDKPGFSFGRAIGFGKLCLQAYPSVCTPAGTRLTDAYLQASGWLVLAFLRA